MNSDIQITASEIRALVAAKKIIGDEAVETTLANLLHAKKSITSILKQANQIAEKQAIKEMGDNALRLDGYKVGISTRRGATKYIVLDEKLVAPEFWTTPDNILNTRAITEYYVEHQCFPAGIAVKNPPKTYNLRLL